MNAPLAPIGADAAPLLPLYEEARAALQLCAAIDEAKEILDRAAALAAYARQRNDNDMLVSMQEIRLRASIRIGEIVRDLESFGVGRPGVSKFPTGGELSKDAAIAAAGLSSGTAYRHADLADLVGAEGENNDAAGAAAAEIYFARCRESSDPATEKGLRAAVEAAVQAAMGPTAIRRAYKGLVREDLAVKAERRVEREVLLGERSQRASARLGTTLYPVIYADPPWDYETWSADTGKGRAAANHYPTMSLDAICALQVPAAPSAVLFLWVPAPFVPQGCRVVEAWGFTFRTQLVWRKPYAGTGLWARSRHENIFIATRGHDVPAPALGQQIESVIDAEIERRQHSLKPLFFADMIARQFPTSPRIELFARERRPGWDAWGNEVEPDVETDVAAGATPDGGASAPSDVGSDDRADDRGAA